VGEPRPERELGNAVPDRPRPVAVEIADRGGRAERERCRSLDRVRDAAIFDAETQNVSDVRIGMDDPGNTLYTWLRGPLKARWRSSSSVWGAITTIQTDLGIVDTWLDVNSSGNAVAVGGRTVNNIPFDYAPFAAYYVY
jgi:hypothetical protein